MKILKLFFLLLFFPLVFHAQKTLTGLWIGTLSNDSTTIRKDQAFEIALTQYKGKVYGYSRMTFTVNDTLYYIIKRIKGTIEDDLCEVKDDEIITHNFPRKPDKGVKLVSTFRRNQEDSIWRLDGDWKTTETKRHGYYSISGKLSLQSEPDFEKSKLFPHLEELNMAKDVEFYAEAKRKEAPANNTQPIALVKKDIATAASDETRKQEQRVKTDSEQPADETIALATLKKSELPANALPASQKNIDNAVLKPEIKKPGLNVKVNEPAAIDEPAATTTLKRSDLPVNTLPASQKKGIDHDVAKPEIKKQELNVKIKEPAAIDEPVAATTLKRSDLPANTLPGSQKKNLDHDVAKPEIKKQELNVKIKEPVVIHEPVETKSATKKTDPATVATMEQEKKIIKTEPSQPSLKISSAAAFVAERKTVAPQVIEFKSDSLEIKLYDNGEIDGDTVSVLLNGEILMARQGLKASAIKKTIYMQPGHDELTLVLYAENLGKYPPNTGLLVIKDGEESYQLRFTADLQQNAAVVFRRKK